jgi:hypothetical protein
MAVSGISIRLDRTHYSRYDHAARVVTVTIFPTGSPAGELVTVAIRRETISGLLPVFSGTVALAHSTAPVVLQVDLATLLDPDGFSLVHFSRDLNDYHLTASIAAPALSAEALFTVVPFTVETVKKRWCFGLPLISIEKMALRVQPQAITGVTLGDPVFGTAIGAVQLVYAPGPPKTLTFGGGPTVQLVPGIDTYVLADGSGKTIIATVDQSLLPLGATSETLYIDYATMSEENILREICGVCSEVEDFLHAYLEPTRVVSRMFLRLEPDKLALASPSGFYDRVVEGLNFYKPDNWLKWLEIKFPYTPVRRFYKLSGYFNQTVAINIDQGLITYDERSGQVSFVPSNLAVINSFFVGPGIYVLFFNQLYVPQFWNFFMLAGFPSIPEPIVEYIGKRVAIDLLIEAGQARYQAGLTGYSVGRDGVSESASLIPGIYRAQIELMNAELGRTPDGRDARLLTLRNKYTPIPFVTL